MKQRIAIIGPAHPLRGGLATFNHRLAQQFGAEGDEVDLISFSLQYPALLFPGKSQYSNDPAPEGLHISLTINSVNPLNWILVGRALRRKRYDIVVVRWWIPFMGPALGTILRQLRGSGTRIVCLVDNMTPHEHRPGDALLTRYFVSQPHAFLCMSQSVADDVKARRRDAQVAVVAHPLYDNFGAAVPKAEARRALNWAPEDKVLLFFGFIRKYKGLDLLLEAMADARVKASGVKLVVAGEFYEPEAPYLQLMEQLDLHGCVRIQSGFISDADVVKYFCAADAVVQPYKHATQSGVTPLAYHFEKPMIVTNVGGLAEGVPHGVAGLVCQPQAESIAGAIVEMFASEPDRFLPGLRQQKMEYSWAAFTDAVRQLAAPPPKS